jgi:hypothetical protein
MGTAVVRHFEITTMEWDAEDVAADPDLGLESVNEARRLVADLDVRFDYVQADHEANSEVWVVTGPDVEKAARRLDADVEVEP